MFRLSYAEVCNSSVTCVIEVVVGGPRTQPRRAQDTATEGPGHSHIGPKVPIPARLIAQRGRGLLFNNVLGDSGMLGTSLFHAEE